MYIRNGKNISNTSNIKNLNANNISDTDTSSASGNLQIRLNNISNISDISDISEIKAPASKEIEKEGFVDVWQKAAFSNFANVPNKESKVNDIESSEYDSMQRKNKKVNNNPRRFKKHGKIRPKTSNELNINTENKTTRLAKYLYDRKYFILLFSVIYIVGLTVGAILIKNIEIDEIISLRDVIDNYFTDVSSASMISRIINNIAVNGIILLLSYLSGVTIFAPFICAVVCLYKGLSCGYIIGVYIAGGANLFYMQICCLTFIFYLLIMLCFILAFSESTGFSVFLLKSRESYRNNLSFSNIIAYSSRYILFLLVMSLFTVLQTIIISVAYSYQ